VHAVTVVDHALAWRRHPRPAPGPGELPVRVAAGGKLGTIVLVVD
jgi:hypothetical protein